MTDQVRFKYHDHDVSLKKFRLMIDDEVILATVDSIIELAQEELGDMRCPVHGQAPELIVSFTEDGDLNVHTHACCEDFKHQTSTTFQARFHNTAYFNPGMRVLLLPEGADMPFSFEAEEIESLSIGRSDSDSRERPDVDLCRFRAAERGVSRRHASILWHRGALHIIDEGSSNGTYVNGERLEAHQPYVLRDEDQVHLGGLALKVMLLGGPK